MIPKASQARKNINLIINVISTVNGKENSRKILLNKDIFIKRILRNISVSNKCILKYKFYYLNFHFHSFLQNREILFYCFLNRFEPLKFRGFNIVKILKCIHNILDLQLDFQEVLYKPLRDFIAHKLCLTNIIIQNSSILFNNTSRY
jgi:hypothetical protein